MATISLGVLLGQSMWSKPQRKEVRTPPQAKAFVWGIINWVIITLLGDLGWRLSVLKMRTALSPLAFFSQKCELYDVFLRVPLTKYRVWQAIGGGTLPLVVAHHPPPTSKTARTPTAKDCLGKYEIWDTN